MLIFWGIIDSQNLWNAKFANNLTKEEVETTPYIVMRYLFYQELPFAFIVIVCITMGTMLLFFTIYHLWLAVTNITTNERYKRAALMNFYFDKLELLNMIK